MDDRELSKDIDNLDRKIRELREKETGSSEKGSSTYIGAAHIGIRIAADLLSGIAVGAGIGYVLDKVFDTRPYLFAVFLLFGGAAGFLNVYRMAKDEENKKGVR